MKRFTPSYLFVAVLLLSLYIANGKSANHCFNQVPPGNSGGDTIIHPKPIIPWPSGPLKTPSRVPVITAIYYGDEIVISSTWASGLDYEISNEEGVQLSGILYYDNDSINVSSLSPGVYTLQLSTESYEVNGTFYK